MTDMPVLRPGLVETLPPLPCEPTVLIHTWADFNMKYRGGWDATSHSYKINDVVEYRIDNEEAAFVCRVAHVSTPEVPPYADPVTWYEWGAEGKKLRQQVVKPIHPLLVKWPKVKRGTKRQKKR